MTYDIHMIYTLFRTIFIGGTKTRIAQHVNSNSNDVMNISFS
jgi:hypothetical protein